MNRVLMAMLRPAALLLAAAPLLVAPLAARDALEKRIVHAAPDSYRALTGVHGGAGELRFGTLLPGSAFGTNFLFVHRGEIQPKGGIGHHVHSHMEEMFFILDNEAQFTINGHTSHIAGPASVPCRMSNSHAIYNPTDRPTQWMNIAVSTRKGIYDAFDLGDDRVGAPLDKIPVFISARFEKTLLKPVEKQHGGRGTVLYRRALAPEVFYTNWSYVDHLVLPPGASTGKKRHPGVEEFYYVLAGSGLARVNDESAAFKKDDGLAILLDDVHSFENTGGADLELIIVGVAVEKWKLDTVEVK
jgi:mannose-6-phosphate isomerase-like protein (cupin superfamily)